MVLKAIKDSLKKKLSEKYFCQKNSMEKKTNLDKKLFFLEIFQSFSVRIFSVVSNAMSCMTQQ